MGTEKEEVIEVTATEDKGEVADGKATDTETQDEKTGDQAQEAEHQDATDGEKTTDGKTKEGQEARPPKDKDGRKEFFKKQEKVRKDRERKLERENAELRGELRAIEKYGLQKPTDQTTAAPKAEDLAAQFVKANPKPRAEDFDTAADHAEAVARWTYRQERYVEDKTNEAKETQAKQTTAKTEQDRAQQAFQDSVESLKAKGEEKYEDFEELVGATTYHPATLAAMAASEAGEDVAYYLASNPQEIERISKLNPILQAKEVGRIELGLETGKLQIKKTTTAPPPARTVAGNAPTKIDASKLSDKEWYKHRQQQKTNSA